MSAGWEPEWYYRELFQKMNPYLPIDGRNDLAREITSHGVVNTSKTALELARARKDRVAGLQKEVDDLKSRLERLERLLSDDHK